VVGDAEGCGGLETAGVLELELDDELSAMRTPEGPSTIPRVVAARMKYCIVVPVLRVLLAFKAASMSFKFEGTNLQWRKWSNFISITVR
jgi:hypothetical protein